LEHSKTTFINGVLKLVSPGTPLREGIDNVLRAKTGGLIVLGYNNEMMHIVDGGFFINCKFSSAYLYELAKMDGAIILSEDGEIHLKTDSLDLFEFSLDEIRKSGMYLDEVIYDLYDKQDNEIAKTEYEEKFIAQGKPIYKCIASVKAKGG